MRDELPNLAIRITTNGILLTPDGIERLKGLGNTDLTISLNSVDPASRLRLMGRNAGDIRPLLRALAGSELPWHASLVAMPQVVGLHDVLQTVQAASKSSAKTIRVFKPGFTDLTPAELRLLPDAQSELERALEGFCTTSRTPLTLEPVRLTSLLAEVVGVVVDSPAARAGIVYGDVIENVAGLPIRSRTEAFQLIYERANPITQVTRDGRSRNVVVEKAAYNSSGLVMHGDLSEGQLSRLRRHCRSNQTIWVMTSVLAQELLRAALPEKDYSHVQVIAVPNHFFGGSITCAGLLTTDDFARILEVARQLPEKIILPKIAFPSAGHDLIGTHYSRLERFGCKLTLL